MQWGQIKSLFIICFLILNVFLAKQLIDRGEETLSFIPEASKEEELELNISGLDRLDNEIYEVPLLYTSGYNFNAVENFANQLPNQEVVVIDDTTLFSRLKTPIDVSVDNEDMLKSALAEHVYLGARFQRYRYLEEAGLMVFFQRINYPIFYNQQALLFVKLNDEKKMTHYMMRALDIVEEEHDDNPQTLLTQYDAIYRLYHNSNILKTGDEVTEVALGYHNLVSLPNGEQLLNPTWRVNVNDTNDYFINAIEGHDYPQYMNFITETLDQFIGLLSSPNGKDVTYYNLNEDRENASTLLTTIRQPFITTYHQLTEVESE